MSDAHFTNKRVCGFAGCGRKSYAFGLCKAHYEQKRRGRSLSKLYSTRRPNGCERLGCAFPGCDKMCLAKGYCTAHYWQLRHKGTLTERYSYVAPKKGFPPRIICDEAPCNIYGLSGHCHVFRGSTSNSGYGQFQREGKYFKVHRYIYEKEVGEIPKGMVIDHMCRNRGCCNPDHLRVVTYKVNVTENIVGASWQIQAAKTHCPHGHEYSPENTVRRNSRRHCRECHRIRLRLISKRKKEMKS